MIRLTQRQINHGAFGLMTISALSILLSLLILQEPGNGIFVGIIILLLSAALWAAYWRGWEYARHILVMFLTLAIALGLDSTGLSMFSPGSLIPIVLALVLTSPFWVAGSGLLMFAILFARSEAGGPYTQVPTLLLVGTIVMGMVFSRLAIDNAERLELATREAEEAQARAELARMDAETERSRVEHQAQELTARAAEQTRLREEIEQQREVIRELSVPVLPVSHDTLVMPLVGALDSTRLLQIQEQALTRIEATRARRLLLDITGVPVVDTQVAHGLLRVVTAARLLGADVALVGIRPEVAQTIVGLGLDLSGVRSHSELQSALHTHR